MRIVNAVTSYFRYIVRMVWPVNLAAFYSYNPDEITKSLLFVSIVFLSVVTIYVIGIGKKYKYLPVGWFWYLGTLVPVIGLVQVGGQSMADRCTYIPFIGLFIMVAWVADDLLEKFRCRKIVLSISATAIILALSVCTYFQLSYWKNSTTLWEHALKVTTGNYIAHNNLGKTLMDKNRFEEALNHFQDALKLRPHYAHALINFGFAYNKLHPQDDIEACRRALKIDPGSLEAYSYLGIAYGKKDRYQEEIETYKKAIQTDPNNAEACNNLGTAFSKVGHWDDAIEMCKKAIEIQPDFVEAYNNLGTKNNNHAFRPA